MRRQRFVWCIAAIGVLGLAASGASAHEVLYFAHLDESHVVNADGSMGTGSDAEGDLEMQADEHSLIFDVLSLSVDGIFPDDLDESHGPNGTAYHIHLGGEGENGPIVIDLGWYVNAGFGTITETATGFEVQISGVLMGIQGAYDMEGTTGLSPEDVIHEMEEGHTYVQIQTLHFPDGEIRGQIQPDEGTPTESESWSGVKAHYRNEAR